MKREEFALALNALLPGCDPEAADKWAEFAAECVDQGQFAHFIPMEHDAASEKWLDTTFAGLCAVNREYGAEIAASVADLACQRCALYPGEMSVAAMVLEGGGDAERIVSMLAQGDLETEPDAPFFLDLPDGAALTRQGPEISIAQSGVLCSLMEKRTEPGFLLADGTALLESERDAFGRYRGGAGMDGMYLQTGRLYAPVRGADGQINAFQEVKPVTGQEREINKRIPNVEQVIAGMRDETIREIGKDTISAAAQVAWYWTYIGALDMAQQLGLIDDTRRQALYREAEKFKPVCEIKAVQPGGHIAAAEMGVEQNANQIDGIINNEAPKPSLRDALRQYQSEVKGQDAQPPGKRPEQER